jgi:hypothetical protein
MGQMGSKPPNRRIQLNKHHHKHTKPPD